MPDLTVLKQYASILGKGLMLQMAPGIAAGLANRLFHHLNVDVQGVIQRVQNNSSFWDELDENVQLEVKDLAGRLRNLDFITAELIIAGIKKEFPAVAGLFVSWPEAMDWLRRQVADLKTRVLDNNPH